MVRCAEARHRSKTPGLEAIIATAFAAPLLRFTGQDGGTICAYGDTGANKSTATRLGLSVCGHPVGTKEVATTSMKSLMQKMGTFTISRCTGTTSQNLTS